MTFSVSLSFANTNMKVSNNPFNLKKNDQNIPLNTNLQDTSESQYSKSETSIRQGLQPNSVATDRRDMNDTNEWSQFIDSYGNSQLVIGLSSGQPNSYSHLANLVEKYKGQIVNTVSTEKDTIAAVVNVSSTMMSSLTSDIQAMGLARYIEPNMKFQATFVPNDPYWPQQWGPAKIQADQAWDTQIGNHSVLVAVIDTGIDWDHPDLAANYVPLGYDWVNDDPDPMDDHGHGTHCAGIIAGVLNNNVGIAGLAQVSIMAEKGLNMYGGGYEDDLANAIVHAVDQGANILSNSWGGYGTSALIYDAVKYAYDHGVLVIAAAGNDATSTKLLPAGYDEVIAVSATDQNDNPAYFTNFGDWVNLAAPGVDIFSTIWNDGYATMSGTSMACPHVSGVAALLWSQFPNRTRDWVWRWLEYTADDLGAPGFDPYYGYGRINARKAVQMVPQAHELIISNWEKPVYIEPGNVGVFNVTVLNFGDNNEADVVVQLLANGTLANSTTISSLPVGESAAATCYWAPTVEGLYNITAYVVPVPGETSVENNVVSTCITVGFPLKAFVLDSAGTDIAEVISTWQELNTNWHLFGSTMIYIDYTTLNKEGITYDDLVATDADVLIISCAYSWQFTDSEIEAITRYVHEGHGLIATAGTFYYMVPNNNKLAPLFGLSETTMWTGTYTDILHLQYPAHPLFVNVPNPYVFPQVGTALPSDGRWDSNELIGGTYLALGHSQESAIVTFRGLVYISPWLEIIPAYYHFHLQLLYNAILWSEYQKPEHELVVSLESPSIVKPNKQVLLNATVQNLGLNNETDVELRLLIDGSIVDSVVIPELANGSSYTLSHTWTPTIESVYNITAYAPPVTGEEFITNNRDTKLTTVTSALAIGIIETHGESLHSEDLTYFYRNLGCLVQKIRSALSPEVINIYDILIVGEDWYNIPWSSSEIAAVEAFIDSGKCFIGIGDELAQSPQEILQTYGISYTGMYAAYGPSSNFDHNHPIMQDVSHIYAGSPVNSLNVAVPAYYIVNDTYNAHILIAGAEVDGKVLSMSDDFAAYVYDYDNHIMFKNILDWVPIYEHDLAVRLEAPTFLTPGESSTLNATVLNRGLNDETNVELQLLIDGIVVDSVLIPTLLTGESHTLRYLWTPTIEGMYNVTAYAPPVPSEEFISNNAATRIASVRYAPKLLVVDTPPPEDTGALDRLGYEYTLVSPTEFATVDLYRFDVLFIGWEPGDTVVNALLARASDIADWVAAGNGIAALAEFSETNRWAWLPLWVSSSQYHADTVHIIDPSHPVLIDLTDAELSGWMNSYHGYFYSYHPDWSALAQGVEAGYPITLAATYGSGRIVITQQDPDYHFYYGNREGAKKLLRNMLQWAKPMIRYEHDIAVSLSAPQKLLLGKSVLLNATVQNLGLNNETNVELNLLINGSVVSSATIPELLVGGSNTTSYLWSPTVESLYNITAYALPVSGENQTRNNAMSKMVTVRYVMVALISDQSQLSAITYILDSMGIAYDIYDDNSIHLYTENLNLLLDYRLVIFNNHDRTITTNEHSALESYLSSGGNLIVTGYDSLGHPDDPLLADIVRSSSVGDNVGEPDLIVVASTHPIMSGPYGIFPVGHHIVGLFSDCDMAEADITRGAVTVAELADGYDKIIATQTLFGGKVVYWNGQGTIDWTGNIDCQAMLENMIDWMLIRHEHDLAVSVVAPSYLEPNETFTLGAIVHNVGLNNETDVDLQLVINGTIVASIVVPSLPVGDSYKLNYLWIPAVEGIYNVTAYAPPVTGETYTTNNIASAYVPVAEIRGTSVRVKPRENVVTLNRNFTISINIVNVTDLFGYEFKLYYDTNILDGLSVQLPPGHFLTPVIDPGNLFIAKMEIQDNYNATHGRVFVAVCLLGPEEPKNGSGVLVNITFKATAIGSSILDLYKTKLSNQDAQAIPHIALDGSVEVVSQPPSGADVAIVSITPSNTATYEGRIVNITVVADNHGTTTETFNVTAYYDSTVIGTQLVVDLPPGENTTLTFSWNTTGLTPCHNYTISAEAHAVPGEIDTTDNFLTDGTVKIKMLGDVNGDGIIDIFDLVQIAAAFGSSVGQPNWDSQADLVQDGIIDVFDLVVIGFYFGNTCP